MAAAKAPIPNDSAAPWYALARQASGEELRLGPVAYAELVHLFAVGRLTPEDLVWHPDFTDWRRAAEIASLGLTAPASAISRAAWPSDALPLWILAGIVLCFVLHFGQRRFAAEAAVAPTPVTQGGETPAAVEVEICNRSDAPKLYTTVAYYDVLRRDWVARGWYPVARGTCLLPLKNVKPPVFVYAETKDGQTHFGGEPGGVRFCLDGQSGFIQPQQGCAVDEESGKLRRPTFLELKAANGQTRVTWELGS